MQQDLKNTHNEFKQQLFMLLTGGTHERTEKQEGQFV